MTPTCRQTLIKANVAALARYKGKSAFIKLRSQCSDHANAFAIALPQAHIVFMFRDKDKWAISRHNHFQERPTPLANMLAENILAMDRLRQAGFSPHIVMYEQLVSDTFTELKGLIPGLDPANPELRRAVEAVLEADSQEGSNLKRKGVDLSASAEFMQEFHAVWSRIKPSELIDQYGLKNILA
jgi:hypothetical protein